MLTHTIQYSIEEEELENLDVYKNVVEVIKAFSKEMIKDTNNETFYVLHKNIDKMEINYGVDGDSMGITIISTDEIIFLITCHSNGTIIYLNKEYKNSKKVAQHAINSLEKHVKIKKIWEITSRFSMDSEDFKARLMKIYCMWCCYDSPHLVLVNQDKQNDIEICLWCVRGLIDSLNGIPVDLLETFWAN